MSFKLSIGKLAFTAFPAYTNEAIAALIVKDEHIAHSNFLYYALKVVNLLETTDKAVKGLTLNKAKLQQIKIPLPPLETQKQIAAVLDKADELRQKRKQANTQLDEFLQSVFLDMFGDPVRNPKGWEKSTLGESCYFIKDGPYVSPNYAEKGIPFVSVNNIIRGKWDLENVQYISKEDHEKFKQRCNPEKTS